MRYVVFFFVANFLLHSDPSFGLSEENISNIISDGYPASTKTNLGLNDFELVRKLDTQVVFTAEIGLKCASW